MRSGVQVSPDNEGGGAKALKTKVTLQVLLRLHGAQVVGRMSSYLRTHLPSIVQALPVLYGAE